MNRRPRHDRSRPERSPGRAPASSISILSKRSLAGYSLIELLIAMSLGLLLISGAFTAFTSTMKSADHNRSITEVQENARFAIERLAADLRMGGYQGCLDLLYNSVDVKATSSPLQNMQRSAVTASVVQADGSLLPALPEFTPPANPALVPGTHALSVMYMRPNEAVLVDQMRNTLPSATGNIIIDRDIGLEANDLAIISNCKLGDLFRVSSVTPLPGGISIGHSLPQNISIALSSAYGNPDIIDKTQIGALEARVYYIGDTGVRTENGDPVHALYLQTWPWDDSNPPIELVQGIENMQVAFGIRTAGDELVYASPNDAAFNATMIEQIRIGLLATSWDDSAQQDSSSQFTLAGNAVIAGNSITGWQYDSSDRRHRAAFNTTVKLRNRNVRP